MLHEGIEPTSVLRLAFQSVLYQLNYPPPHYFCQYAGSFDFLSGAKGNDLDSDDYFSTVCMVARDVKTTRNVNNKRDCNKIDAKEKS